MVDFDYRLGLACGTDIPIPSCKLVLHQPSLKEIGLIGEQVFFTGVQCLSVSKNMFIEDKTDLDDINNFYIFMAVMFEKTAIGKKKDTLSTLQLFFPNYKPNMTPQSIMFMPIGEGEAVTIDENNFEDLQEVIHLVCCLKGGNMDQQSFNPANKKAKEIAEKLMRGRERVAAQKNTSNVSIFGQYISVLSIGLQLSPLDLTGLTMFQLYDLVERYNLYLAWDIDVRSRLAGGKPEKQVENWMKNLH